MSSPDSYLTAVGEHIPVKQGLRHQLSESFQGYPWGRRAYSSKTRIKTRNSFLSFLLVQVGEHIPVKQGLRLKIFSIRLNLSKSASIFQ